MPLKRANADLEKPAAELRAELVRLRRERDEAEAQAKLFRGELQKAFASRSWRVTRPLRAFNEWALRVQSRIASLDGFIKAGGRGAFRPPTAETGQQLSCLVAQKTWDERGRTRLRAILGSGRRLLLPATADPELSIILVLCNKSHLSLLCLESILANADVKCEVIIVDNGSRDETNRLLDRLDGAQILRNRTNMGFAQACMQGAGLARGKYLCFLNNDAQLEPRALSFALCNFMEDASVGAVGGKILLANGRLQEAGSILWGDGSALGYGRDDDPALPQYEFRRPVDYCSGAFLFTPAHLFQELGGFSDHFYPAYYEDTDYCTAVWARGLQVMYEPRAVIRHYESASSGNNDSAKPLMAVNQQKFSNKWRNLLANHLAPTDENVHRGRIAALSHALRVVYVDDRVPHRGLGSGFPRSNDILNQLARQGHQVTCATTSFPLDRDDYSDVSRDVEFFDGYNELGRLCREYLSNADVAWVSRPHNMELMLQRMVTAQIEAGFKIVYDAEAIFADRDRLKAQVLGKNVSGQTLDAWASRELDLAKAADAVVSVCARDQAAMTAYGIPNVHVIGLQLEVAATPASFADRQTFLFVGAMHGSDNPNADSMQFFCNEVWPIVQQVTGAELVIAGYGTAIIASDFRGRGIRVTGALSDLTPLYEEARVFIVPTRYAAGLPFKAYEAAARGVPLVVSSLIGQQLGWQDEEECLIADHPQRFAQDCCRLYEDEKLWSRIRSAALLRVERELTETQFRAAIVRVIKSVTSQEK